MKISRDYNKQHHLALSEDKLAKLIHLRSMFIDTFAKETLKSQIPLVPLYTPNLVILNQCTCSRFHTCSAIGKHPAVSNFANNISSFYNYDRKEFNISTLLDLKSKTPLRNIGAVCGYDLSKTHGVGKKLVVVDIDHEDPWSLDLIKNGISEQEKETFGYRTGSGGMHLWFATDLVSIQNGAKTFDPNIDIRGKNGYVIVPGSIHTSGSLYDFDQDRNQGFHRPILNLPKSILDAIVAGKATRGRPRKIIAVQGLPVVSKQVLPKSPTTTKKLKALIESDLGYKIPMGRRNDSIYRLLAYERTCGSNKKTLMDLAKRYRSRCEDPSSILNFELLAIVNSAYKNKTKKINIKSYKELAKNYFVYKENKHFTTFTKMEKKKIIDSDKAFFKTLTTSDENGTSIFVSLETIHEMRDLYIKQAHGIHGFFRYPQKFLAEKLKEMGFARKRTAKNNLWNVHIPKWNKILDFVKKNNEKVYSDGNMLYSTSRQSHNILGFNMTTAIESPSTEIESEEKKLPEWASKTHRPDIIYGSNVDNENSFVPPGFQDEIKIKYGDTTRHPEENRFFKAGMPAFSHMDLSRKFEDFLDHLTPAEAEDFCNEEFIRDEAATAIAFDAINVGDVIGTLLLKVPTVVYSLEVLKLLPESDIVVCRPWNGEVLRKKYREYTKEITIYSLDSDLIYLSFEDVSYALAMDHYIKLYSKTIDVVDAEPADLDKYCFKPFGFEDIKKEYKMRFRFRIAEGFPGYVADDDLEEQYNTAFEAFVKEQEPVADGL